MKIMNKWNFIKLKAPFNIRIYDKRRVELLVYSFPILILTASIYFFSSLIFLPRESKSSLQIAKESIGGNYVIGSKEDTNVLGLASEVSYYDKIRTDVGFIDIRVLTLEEIFTDYDSPLKYEADEFIKASEKYGMENWQLLPAIALAETVGCKTGSSHLERNCWGWGGSGVNRWTFTSYAEAIDLITYRLMRGYGNEHLDPKSIQPTYCGVTCQQWGWRWARGVDYYIRKINDYGVKYGLERTHETTNWSNPPGI